MTRLAAAFILAALSAAPAFSGEARTVILRERPVSTDHIITLSDLFEVEAFRFQNVLHEKSRIGKQIGRAHV